jgi:hypothetical protein
MTSNIKNDWLLISTAAHLLRTDNYISLNIVDTPDGGKRLIASGIDPSTIEKLSFLVNTDTNNNYLYLEDFKVYTAGYFSPVNIPGFLEIIQHSFRMSDITAFTTSDSKVHYPFAVSNYNSTSNSGFGGATFSEFVSTFANLMPFTPKIDSNVTYSITLSHNK